MSPPDLQALADRAAIHDLVVGYFLAVDRRDWEAVRGCFSDDAELDYAVFRGPRDEVLAAIQRGLAFFESTMHFGGNVLVELAGDVARCESYAVCYHRHHDGDRLVDRVCALHYRDALARDGEVWRIRRRRVTFVWERLDPVTLPPVPR
ncbi:MAG: nuclear transport factor 2 family protein [bacterium]|nr:nuclear transport factor 2 family protein [bacterium]